LDLSTLLKRRVLPDRRLYAAELLLHIRDSVGSLPLMLRYLAPSLDEPLSRRLKISNYLSAISRPYRARFRHFFLRIGEQIRSQIGPFLW